MTALVLGAAANADTTAGAAARVLAAQNANAALVARIERLPISRRLLAIRVVVGIATFFDAYTVLAIAFAMPELVREWKLGPGEIGLIISAGYIGQLVGAVTLGWLAEKVGRLQVLLYTIIMFTVMSIGCVFAWSAMSMIVFRFLQGIGTGAEVPVASAYINEFIGAHKRGRFFLLYEVIFPVGLMFAGLIGSFLVPAYGWKAMFIVGIVPSALTIPLRWFMPESPRWLASRGRIAEAEAVVQGLEDDVTRRGVVLPAPVLRPIDPKATQASDWRDLFRGLYLKRTLMIWVLWVCSYLVNNGMITWLPTLYRQVFHLSLQTSLYYGWVTSTVGVIASVICALLIDRVGRKPWYAAAFLFGAAPLAVLAWLGASDPIEVLVLTTAGYAVLQTIAFSLYLYSAELYPTRLRAIGAGFGSAWLRAGSSVGPAMVGLLMADFGIGSVFASFACVAVVGGIVTILFAIETKGRVLEELSP